MTTCSLLLQFNKLRCNFVYPFGRQKKHTFGLAHFYNIPPLRSPWPLAAIQCVLRLSQPVPRDKSRTNPSCHRVLWSRSCYNTSSVVISALLSHSAARRATLHTSLNQFHLGSLDPREMWTKDTRRRKGGFSPPSGECPSSSEPAPLGAGPSRPPSAHHAALPCGPGPGRQSPEGCRRSSGTNHGSAGSRERTERLKR